MSENSASPDPQKPNLQEKHRSGKGWSSLLAKFSMATLLFEAISGLAITFSPFHPTIQWSVILHTVIGVLTLLPLAWYCTVHWLEYKHYTFSHIVLLGYAALLSLVVCSVSGVILTVEAFFALKTTPLMRGIHLISTYVILAGILPHILLVAVKAWKGEASRAATAYLWQSAAAAVFACLLVPAFSLLYSGSKYVNVFPEDYSFLYGTNRPFAPSLAKTDSGGAFDARSLAGSVTCGTSGCHVEITEEWLPSAHRYAALDPVFQGIQDVMAKQNGPESTRYCGGCHDPISLFSGTKNVFAENLTGLHGYKEGVSCLSCHAIRETDVKGNANYTITQPAEYLWQWETNGLGKQLRDFLIRSYPAEHNKLAKRSFKKPEYCAACHKQFIDQEVNRVGWVQLQNQYDNWSASHWNHKGDAKKTIECRECHMPLVASRDPAAGDPMDYNRDADDGKHRSHRFIGANQFVPSMTKIEGWEEQVRLTEQWLQGKTEVPEIKNKWTEGPIVKLALVVPETVAPGEDIPLRVVMTSSKVGHDFPTGPLDIIQSWLDVTVTDASGLVVYTSGKRDEKNFIEKGSFLFKAEPVDQHGNLIDRHNLWEMVGVRYRRALFPGYSDTVQFTVPCSGAQLEKADAKGQHPTNSEHTFKAPAREGEYHVSVALHYRKVDQFLLNFLFGEEKKITSPVTELVRTETIVKVRAPGETKLTSSAGGN